MSYRIPVLESFEFQPKVLDKDLAAPPSFPVKGDRYIIASGASGDWNGKDKYIAWYDGSIWKFDVPKKGTLTYVDDEDKYYSYNGSSWIDVGTAIELKDAIGKKHSPHSDDQDLSGLEEKNNKGQPNGYSSLDGSGKILVTELPNAIMTYQGTWDASTNTPTLEDGMSGVISGDVYRVSVAGTQNLGSGNISFEVGDYCIYNGSTWEKADTTDAVTQINGKIGEVNLVASDIPTDESSETVQDKLDELNSKKASYDPELDCITFDI